MNNEMECEENIKSLQVKNKNRNVSLDIARTFAIICVVLCHCTETLYNMNNSQMYSVQSQIFKTISFTIGRLGVPIFLFISGALLLKKQINNDEAVFLFYRKNLLPIIITTEIWIIIYNIFFNIIGTRTLSIKNIIKEMLFFVQTPFNNMWYMPMIIGLYLAIPFIAKIVKTFSIKTMLPALLIVLFYTSILPTFNVVRGVLNLSKYRLYYRFEFFRWNIRYVYNFRIFNI